MLYGLIAILVGAMFYKGVKPAWQRVNSDFGNYYVASKLVSERATLDSLYDDEWFHARGVDFGVPEAKKFSPFPPCTSWIMVPLTTFSALTAQRILTVINILLLFPGILLVRRFTGWSLTLSATVVFGSGLSLINNIAFGQIYWIMTVTGLWALALESNGMLVVAGFILALFSAVKYFPVVFLIGYGTLGRPYVRLTIAFILTLVAIIALQYAFFGQGVMTSFITSALIPHFDGRLSGQGLYSMGFQSWSTFYRFVFVQNSEFNPNPLIDWPPGAAFANALTALAVAIAAVVTLFRARGDKAKFNTLSLSIPALAALVILPASATYHFILMLIPLVILIGGKVLDQKWCIAVMLTYCMMGWIPYTLAYNAGLHWGIILGFPRLWFLVAIYFVVIWRLNRKNESRT